PPQGVPTGNPHQALVGRYELARWGPRWQPNRDQPFAQPNRDQLFARQVRGKPLSMHYNGAPQRIGAARHQNGIKIAAWARSRERAGASGVDTARGVP